MDWLASADVATVRQLTPPNALTDNLFSLDRESGLLDNILKLPGHHILYHYLARALRLRVPIEWLSCFGMIRSWSKAVAAVAFEDDHAAKNLFQLALIKGCGLEETSSGAPQSILVKKEVREAFSHTLSSSCNFLAAVAMESHLQTLDSRSAYRILEESAHDIIERYDTCSAMSSDNEVEGQEIAARAQRAASVLTVTLLARIVGCSLDPGLAHMDVNDAILTVHRLYTQASRVTKHRLDVLESLPSLICSVAQISTRFRPTTTFEETKRLVDALAYYEGEISASSIWFLRRLAVDTADYFARNSSCAEYLAFAEDVKIRITESGEVDLRLNPFLASADGDGEAPGFRWEEGICEWVAATPKLVLKKPKILADKIPVPEHFRGAHRGKPSLRLSHVMLHGGPALDAAEPYTEDSIPGTRLRGGASPLPRRRGWCQLTDITNIVRNCQRKQTPCISDIEDDEDELTGIADFVKSTVTKRSIAEVENDEDELSLTEIREKRQRRMGRAPRKRDTMRCLSYLAVFGREEAQIEKEAVAEESDDELSGF
ncbi:hypothetical protein LTS18_005708 [Coniosporium uncinatum]|uniref:Uncharacterized protein n=1 Tax=Coniosporium uncinatum TaxID=93489 RepID=A0ACC3DQV1_9PEZI|nr:hypothetical protein LTS18_005708 [Coniosporium uncinatum]